MQVSLYFHNIFNSDLQRKITVATANCAQAYTEKRVDTF